MNENPTVKAPKSDKGGHASYLDRQHQPPKKDKLLTSTIEEELSRKDSITPEDILALEKGTEGESRKL